MVTQQTALAWAAGFLEGEGSFMYTGGRHTIQAAQSNKQPLVRLRRLMGGWVHGPYHYRPGQPWWLWSVQGPRARRLMRLLLLRMTRRRQEQIRRALKQGVQDK